MALRRVAIFILSICCAPALADTLDAGSGWLFRFDLPTPPPASMLRCKSCDESVDHTINFAFSENDPRISDLFDGNGDSQLCFPTALANTLVYLFHYHDPRLSHLALAGLSEDKTTLDGSRLVRSLVGPCHTDRDRGTGPINAIGCAKQALTESGYDIGDSGLISWRDLPNPQSEPIEKRALKIDDITKYVRRGDAVILEVGWYELDDSMSARKRTGGHYVGVYGFDHQAGQGSSRLTLKVLDPRELTLSETGEFRTYATVEMFPMSSVGVEPPTPDAFFSLQGPGFGGGRRFPVVESILHFAPQAPQ